MGSLPSLRLRPPMTPRFPSSRPKLPTTATWPKSAPAGDIRCSAVATAGGFTWEDVFSVSRSEDLSFTDRFHGFFERVRSCNRGIDEKLKYVPFKVEDDILGYAHKGFLKYLRSFPYVFVFSEDGKGHVDQVALHSALKSPDERTEAIGEVIKELGEGVFPGIRNELYPVKSRYGLPVTFSLERAAAPYFGIKAYGVHMNGYVNRNGQEFLWIGKRSEVKPTFPGMLDHLVAGGLPHGMSCKDCLVKECEEEAGISRSIANRAVPVGAVSYVDIDGYRFKRDVLFCYDLELPDGFVPHNQDGEVDSFKLLPVTQVADIIRTTNFFKPNCALVIIDFLFRHGYISPDHHRYLELLQCLRSGDCS